MSNEETRATIISGEDVVLENYTKPVETGAVLATDNVNQAIGKLERGTDQYMKKADYCLKENPGVVNQAYETEYALFAEKLTNEDRKILLDADDVAAIRTTANSAMGKASEAIVGLAGKVDTIDGKGLSSNDYTSEEKAKLEGIEAGANKYEHPATHPTSMIVGLPNVEQKTGASVTDVMSQKAVTDEVDTCMEAVVKVQNIANNAMPKVGGHFSGKVNGPSFATNAVEIGVENLVAHRLRFTGQAGGGGIRCGCIRRALLFCYPWILQ
ncbi:MAG: hypothetical protein VB081_02840 [Christensenella sp.]|uniref:hypothetical protein n=1 Tax=Christensenella sp. TaxID=1935934 RepID=UPI002B2011F9|nr:hypothetical protein [Christensenella sp.]MEA5002416.1 hypothetical protein [Christensenella sp.]